jgi:hypothetical protein
VLGHIDPEWFDLHGHCFGCSQKGSLLAWFYLLVSPVEEYDHLQHYRARMRRIGGIASKIGSGSSNKRERLDERMKDNLRLLAEDVKYPPE